MWSTDLRPQTVEELGHSSHLQISNSGWRNSLALLVFFLGLFFRISFITFQSRIESRTGSASRMLFFSTESLCVVLATGWRCALPGGDRHCQHQTHPGHQKSGHGRRSSGGAGIRCVCVGVGGWGGVSSIWLCSDLSSSSSSSPSSNTSSCYSL